MNSHQKEALHTAIAAVVEERQRQHNKWGVQNHEPGDWMLILMEEVGEFSQAVLDARSGDPAVRANIRTELVQFIAVGMAMLETCDRNRWSKR